MKKVFAILLCCAFLLGGCKNTSAPAETMPAATTAIDTDNLFSDRDKNPDYNEKQAVSISLQGTTAASTSSAVEISGSDLLITQPGTYILSGTLKNGTVTIHTEKTEKVQLVLKNASIHSNTSAPLLIEQADKVFITLPENTENVFSNDGSFPDAEDTNIDAVIFSKEDVTLNGSGSLTVNSPGGHGVVSKDALTITGGTYNITSASHGLSGKDSISITNAKLDIATGKDGIHAENAEDTSLGFLYIESGSYNIVSEGDGISASGNMQIDSGSFDLLCGGGNINGEQHTSENWGNMGGGGRPGGMGGGMPGGKPGGMPGGRAAEKTASFTSSDMNTLDTSEDSTSIKGLKAGASLTINGGTFLIDSADDAIHSNGDLTLCGGTLTMLTGDDGFHADNALVIRDGTADIQKSYEGLEGLTIDILGGNIKIIADDDGLNAAGGTDQSGFGGPRGDNFSSTSSSDSYIHIAGGTLYVTPGGDGIDSNGALEISGGHTTVTGTTVGDTAVLDYDTTGTISGGTFIGTGATTMAQTLNSTGEQGVFSVQMSYSEAQAGTKVILIDSSGKEIISYQPNLSFAFIVLSSPDIAKGESYTITVGDATGTFEAS